VVEIAAERNKSGSGALRLHCNRELAGLLGKMAVFTDVWSTKILLKLSAVTAVVSSANVSS
jgi:hypothetical protein